MGISYDPPSRKWNIKYEKTDNETNLPILNTVSITAQVQKPNTGGAYGPVRQDGRGRQYVPVQYEDKTATVAVELPQVPLPTVTE
jgi:hypothetical protein